MKSSFVGTKHDRESKVRKMLQERETLMEEIRQLRAAVQIYSYLAQRASGAVERAVG
jgi:hypothetical protein